MRIEKRCKNEIIQYEILDKYNLKQTYFDLDGKEKKSKEININKCHYGRQYYTNIKNVFEYLINWEDYILIESED